MNVNEKDYFHMVSVLILHYLAELVALEAFILENLTTWFYLKSENTTFC